MIGVHWAGQDDNESSGGRYRAASGQTSRHSSDSFGGVGGVVVVVSAGVVTFLGQPEKSQKEDFRRHREGYGRHAYSRL